jgi:ketosteroid isomerase-like protein
MTDGQKRELANAFLQNLRTKDWTRMRTLFTEDATWHLPGENKISGLATGADAVVARAEQIASYGLNFAVKHILYGPDGFALSLNNTARRDDLVLDEHLATVCQVRDGKIAHILTYLSDVPMMNAFFA